MAEYVSSFETPEDDRRFEPPVSEIPDPAVPSAEGFPDLYAVPENLSDSINNRPPGVPEPGGVVTIEQMEAIYNGYLPLVRRIVRNRIGSGMGTQSYEDPIQEVFAALYKHFIDEQKPLKPGQCIGKWIVPVTRNKVADAMRSEIRRRSDAYTDEPVLHDVLKEKPDLEADVVEAAVALERQALVHEALSVLPEHQREVVEMRQLQDASVRETAEALGLSESNVRVIMHRAIKVMRAYLQAPSASGAVLRERPVLRHSLDLDRMIPHPKGSFTSEELKEYVGYQRETALRRSQIRPPHGDYTPQELREYMGHQYAAILRHERDSYWP